MTRRTIAALASLALLAGCASSSDRQARRDVQADYGAGVYRYACARCHAPGHSIPPLTGQTLTSHFATAQQLYAFVDHAMPLDQPGSLPDADYWAVIAHLLDQAGLLQMPADRELDAGSAAAIRLSSTPVPVPATTETAPSP